MYDILKPSVPLNFISGRGGSDGLDPALQRLKYHKQCMAL